jgi:hypothetical protein
MVYAEEEQERIEKIEQRPVEDLFNGATEKELIESYKQDKKDQKEEKCKKLKDEGDSTIEETHFFQERKG